jgi:hypothetical protein
MSKCKLTMTCSGCGEDSKIEIVKPSYFQPSTGTYKCDCCESTVQYFIKKVANDIKKVSTSSRVINPSTKLFDFIAEKAGEKNG